MSHYPNHAAMVSASLEIRFLPKIGFLELLGFPRVLEIFAKNFLNDRFQCDIVKVVTNPL